MRQKIGLSVLVVAILGIGGYLLWYDTKISGPVEQPKTSGVMVHIASSSSSTSSENPVLSYGFLFESEQDPYHGNIVGYFGGGAFSIYVPDWMVQNWDMHIPNPGETTSISPKIRRNDDDFSDIQMYMSTSTEQFNAVSLYEAELQRTPSNLLVENEVLLSRPGKGGTTISTENNTRIYHVKKTYTGRTSDVYYLDGRGQTLEISFNSKSELYSQFSDHIRDFVEGIGELKPYQG